MNTTSPWRCYQCCFSSCDPCVQFNSTKRKCQEAIKRQNFMFWPYLNLLNSVTRGKSILRRKEGNDLPRRPHAATRCSTYFVCASVCLLFLKCHLCLNGSKAQHGEMGRKANWEKFCVSGLAVAQLPLTCLISRVFNSLSPAFRGCTPH